MGNAARVGLFVTVFIGLLIGAYAVLGRSLFNAATTRYFADFNDVAGVTPGTRVLLAGVKVGQVEAVTLTDSRTARLTLAVNPDVKLPGGTRAVINSSLIGFGDQPVLLEPGTSPNALGKDAVIPGLKAGPLDNILPGSQTAVEEVTAILKEVRSLIGDPQLKSDLKALVANSQITAKEFGAVAARVDRLIAANEGQLSLALRRGTDALANVQLLTARVANLLKEDGMTADVEKLLAQLMETAKKADRLVADMNRLVADPSLGKTTGNIADISETGKGIAENVKTITETGKSIATNTEKMTQNGVKITENITDLTERTKKVLDGAVEIEQRVNRILDTFEKRLGGAGPKLPPIQTRMDISRETEPRHIRTDFSARIPLKEGFVDFGVYDAFERNRITLQIGQPVSPQLTYRYGIFAGKPGLGVDYQLSPKWSIRNDVWDLNNPRFDTRLQVEFGKGLYGWAGLDRTFRSNSPVFGIGIQR